MWKQNTDSYFNSGFLKKPISNRKAKKKKSKGGKEDGEEGKEMGSDGEERRSETPTPEHGEVEESSTGAGGSYRETPPSISLPASDPWADFNQPSSRKNFYSSSDRCPFRARCLAFVLFYHVNFIVPATHSYLPMSFETKWNQIKTLLSVTPMTMKWRRQINGKGSPYDRQRRGQVLTLPPVWTSCRGLWVASTYQRHSR